MMVIPDGRVSGAVVEDDQLMAAFAILLHSGAAAREGNGGFPQLWRASPHPR